MGEISIGTCGYSSFEPPDDSREASEGDLAAFASTFDLVELDRTFHSHVDVSTAEDWLREAREANPEFTVTVVGWQGLTHAVSAPTWRGADSALTAAERDAVGDLQPNQTVLEGWIRTKATADALEAPVVVLQTPPGFDCSDGHESNVREFCASIDREGVEIAWEPQGDWAEAPERVRAICEDCDLVHVTDPLQTGPLATTDVAYCRLHGGDGAVSHDDYSYGEDELEELVGILDGLAAGHERVFCLFDNYDMYENAAQLAALLR